MKQRGKKKKKRIKRNEDNLRYLWDNVKHPNIQITGVPEEEDENKGHEKILEELTVENFPKMGKEIATQVQETQRVPKRIKPRQNTALQFSLVAQSCPTLCDPMDCSTPGFPVHHQLKLMSIESVMPSNHLILCHHWVSKHPRHILIKLMKIKHKEQILKAAREKQQITHKGIPIRITADLSTEILQARRNGRTYLKR